MVTRGIRDREGTEARAEETRERGGEGGSIAGAGREGARDGRERAGTRARVEGKSTRSRGGAREWGWWRTRGWTRGAREGGGGGSEGE